jgi:uncharacterized protein YacL
MITELNINEFGISNNVFVIASNFVLIFLLAGFYFIKVWYLRLSFFQIHVAALNFLFDQSRKKLNFKYYQLYLCLAVGLIVQLLIFGNLYITSTKIESFSITVKFISIIISFFVIMFTIKLFIDTINSIIKQHQQWQSAASFYYKNKRTFFKINAFLALKVSKLTYRTIGAFSCVFVDNKTVKIKDLTVVFEEHIKIKYHDKFYIFDDYADLVKRFDKEVMVLK